MGKYKEKVCFLCGEIYVPNSPKQKYCVNCKVEGRKIRERKWDRIRNRKKYNYIEYTRNCKYCGIEFKTYYKKKVYCGAEECEKVRLCIKNKRIHARRSREYMIAKGRRYYKENRKKCLEKKAVLYRENHPDAIPYIGGKVPKWALEDVRKYVESRGYKLLSDHYTDNKQKILLECPKGHKWKTTFHGFKDGKADCCWCYGTSKFEKSVREYVSKIYSGPVIYNDRKQIINPNTNRFLELDLWFPKLNKAIECNGIYWHKRKKAIVRDKIKQLFCEEQGIDLLVITDDDWPSEVDEANINQLVNGEI